MLKRLIPVGLKRWRRSRRCLADLRSWSSHDEELKVFYSTLVRPGELAFDIGANVGNRSKVFLAIGAEVVALEPQPGCAEIIRKGLGSNPHLRLIEKAVGSGPGQAEIFLSEATGISSMNSDWINAVKKSGRFGAAEWKNSIQVEVTTLSALIAQLGKPVFIKIDVEGYEREVLAGLNQPVKMVSIEYTPETKPLTLACFDHLESLSPVEYNFSSYETMKFDLPEWCDRKTLLQRLDAAAAKADYYGDIYIRSHV